MTARLVTLNRGDIRTDHEPAPAGVAFATLDPSGASVATICARVPAQSARALGGCVEGAGLIVSIGGGGEERTIEIRRVAAWFGLTPAEARLATALAAGVSLQDYCALRNVSLNAGRFLLKGVFRKTEVATQAKLVALVSRLPQQS